MRNLRSFCRLQTVFVSSILLATLTACSSDGEQRPEYLDARSAQGLEIPPRLTAPDTSRALRLPKPGKEALDRHANGETKETVSISPTFSGMRLKHEDGLHYLEVDLDVETLWSTLPEFLATEGIAVSRVDKVIGQIDTDWMNEFLNTHDGETSGWLGRFSPDYKDRFRLRVEAVDSKTSRLYAAHRGMQIVVNDDVTQWQQRQSEAVLEREMLYRFLLFAGAGKQQATGVLAGYKTLQPRAYATEGKQNQITVSGIPEHVWARLRVALDRVGAETLEVIEQARTLVVSVGSLKVSKKKESDEGWFSSLFGKDVDIEDSEEYEESNFKAKEKSGVSQAQNKLKLKLVQQVSDSRSTIHVSFADGQRADSAVYAFRDALLEQLK